MAILSLRIGIETEVLLSANDIQDQVKPSLEDFASGLVQHYNARVSERSGQTEMRTAFDTWHASEDPINFQYWSVLEEPSIDPDEDHCKRLSCSFIRPSAEVCTKGPGRQISSQKRVASPNRTLKEFSTTYTGAHI